MTDRVSSISTYRFPFSALGWGGDIAMEESEDTEEELRWPIDCRSFDIWRDGTRAGVRAVVDLRRRCDGLDCKRRSSLGTGASGRGELVGSGREERYLGTGVLVRWGSCNGVGCSGCCFRASTCRFSGGSWFGWGTCCFCGCGIPNGDPPPGPIDGGRNMHSSCIGLNKSFPPGAPKSSITILFHSGVPLFLGCTPAFSVPASLRASPSRDGRRLVVPIDSCRTLVVPVVEWVERWVPMTGEERGCEIQSSSRESSSQGSDIVCVGVVVGGGGGCVDWRCPDRGRDV